MSEKKVVSRKVVIAFGIACIILLVGLLWTVVNYTSLNSTYQNYVATHSYTDSQYSSLSTTCQSYMTAYQNLNTTLQSYMTAYQNALAQYNSLSSTYQSYKSTHTYTDSEYNLLSAIVNLSKSTIWVDDETVSQKNYWYTSWTFSASYAGYVEVYVESSTTTNTYTRVIYSSCGVDYDNTITVGTSGTGVFPILPCTSIEVRVGNTNLVTGATETVTITYYY